MIVIRGHEIRNLSDQIYYREPNELIGALKLYVTRVICNRRKVYPDDDKFVGKDVGFGFCLDLTDIDCWKGTHAEYMNIKSKSSDRIYLVYVENDDNYY